MGIWLTINLAVSWGLLVLIWLVQIIIYPGFSRVPKERFKAYHRWYTSRIAVIVLPLMATEIAATIVWLGAQPLGLFNCLSAATVAVVWFSTFAFQVPVHRRLQHGKDDTLIRRLVATNWLRTLAWSLKALAVTAAAL